MKSFKLFSENYEPLDHSVLGFSITESLNTPEEFYLTDDTKLPHQVFGAFQIDGTDYGVSLEVSNFKRVYIMKFYRIVGNKRRFWAFKKATDIRPALSTIIKFSESSLPFIKMQMDGVIIEIPGKFASSKFNRFVEMLMKKTYVKSFRFVPVVQNTDKSYNYIFFTRKAINPAALFKSAAFKAYNFEVNGALSVDAADDIKPKKIEKVSVTLKPSTKYQFKDFNVDVISDEETYNVIQTVKPKSLDDDKEIKNKVPVPKWEDYIPTKLNDEQVDGLIGLVFQSGSKSVIKNGFDENKLNFNDMKYVINSLSKHVKKYLYYRKVIEDDGTLTMAGKAWAREGLKKMAQRKTFPLSAVNSVRITILSASSDIESAEIKNDKNTDKNKASTFFESNINPDSLKVNIPGAGVFDMKTFDESNEKIYEKEKHLKDVYCKNYKESSPSGSISALKSYTGSGYHDTNGLLRDLGYVLFENKPISNVTKSNLKHFLPKIKKMSNGIFSAPPLKEGMWVYRGAAITDNTPEATIMPGQDYSDPAFLSTSLKSHNTFGMHNIKWRIYLPPGTPAWCALGTYSNHPGEMEIILPPASVQKIIHVKKTVSYSFPYYHVTSIYVGSAWKEYEAKMQMLLNEETTYMNEEIKKYDPNNKFGGKVTDQKISRWLAQLLKKAQEAEKKKIKK